jgi:hypothetical protein
MIIAEAVYTSKSRELCCKRQAQQDATQTVHGHTHQTGDTGTGGPVAVQEGRQTPTRGGWDIDRGNRQDR